jgi:L-ascorbate metabolism protein UlaG (beta-lactamase superfamily)
MVYRRRRKKAKTLRRATFVLLASLFGVFFHLSGCEQFGALPSGDRYLQIQKSENYNLAEEKFVNLEQDSVLTGPGFWDNPGENWNNNFFFNNNQTRPEGLLPESKTPLPADFHVSSDNIKFVWLGHSTILASIDGKVVLFDPIFSNAASPVSLVVKRFQPPVIDLASLPEIDIVVISHDHYDHLDMETIKQLHDRDISFVVPLGLGAHLEHWGVSAQKITELDWWEETEIDGLNLICTPSQHFSGRRGPYKEKRSLWASWLIKSPSQSVYFSGDSGYADHYRQIGERYGSVDLVFMDSGQYNARWRHVHNMPEEAVQAVLDMDGQLLVPIHWGMFTLSMHDWFEPPVRVLAEAARLDVRVLTPLLGQLVDVSDMPENDEWWEQVN